MRITANDKLTTMNIKRVVDNGQMRRTGKNT